MPQPRLCLHTQTPLLRFLGSPAPRDAPIEALREGVDHLPSPGGVTRMVRALLGRLVGERRVGSAVWLSLASNPGSARLTPAVRLDQVGLPPAEQAEYAHAKAALWEHIHFGDAVDVPRVRDGLDLLARSFGARSAALHEEDPFDLFYTHDFQLLPLARRLPAGVPRVFRWHVPVGRFSPEAQAYVRSCLDAYDGVIVSTRAYAEAFRRMGVRTPVHATYPYVDEARRRVVTPEDVAAFDARWGLKERDVVFLVVARLDPMKRQDVAIRALARLRKRCPEAKLLLVGGGGFSAGRQGLGLDHASRWREDLERLARDLGVGDRVVFTGTIPDDDLDVAYTRARAVILPSEVEGFGLAAVEGWLFGRPALVSRGAGVSELVRDGENGRTHATGDDTALAEAMMDLARDAGLAERWGREGRRTARACHLRRGADDVWGVLSKAMDGAVARGRHG